MGSCTNHPSIRARRDGLCDDCLAAAEAKADQLRNASPAAGGEPAAPKGKRGRRPRAANASATGAAVVRIDFAEHKEILDLLGEMATHQFRSIEGQILFLLDQATQTDD
jgi:hypothetical protein